MNPSRTLVREPEAFFQKIEGYDYKKLIEDVFDMCDPMAGFPTCAEAYAVMSNFNNYEV